MDPPPTSESTEKKMKVDETIQPPEMTSTTPPDSTTDASNSNNGQHIPHDKETNENSTEQTDSLTKIEETSKIDSTTVEAASPPFTLPALLVEKEIDLKVVFNKQQLQIRMSLNKTVGDLKLLIEKETNVAPALQKIVLKGIPKDDATLESLGVTKLTKIMVIGTTLSDVMAISKPPTKETLAVEEQGLKKDASNWCSVLQHKKGVPVDAMPAILNESEPLPEIPLYGMLNSKGGKVRLTFKLEVDELWIGTKERTEKVPIGSIRHVESQPIVGYEHYHIVAIQLGPTEASRYFVYWVPAQYIDSIKDSLAN